MGVVPPSEDEFRAAVPVVVNDASAGVIVISFQCDDETSLSLQVDDYASNEQASLDEENEPTKVHKKNRRKRDEDL